MYYSFTTILPSDAAEFPSVFIVYSEGSAFVDVSEVLIIDVTVGTDLIN